MRITTSKFWTLCFALCIALGVLSGCDKATTPGDPVDPTDPTADTQSITVTMPLEDTGVVTRAGDAAAEVAIKSAYIIIYADKVADDALPKFTATIDVSTITVDEANNKVLPFPKDDGIVTGDDVRVVFNHTLASLNVAKGRLKDALKITTATDVTSGGLVDITKGLPMYGAGSWGVGAKGVKGATLVSVKRGVAKVQLLLDYRGGDHVEGVMGAGYTTENTTFKLYQLSNVGYADGSFATATSSEAVTGITNEGEINQKTVSTALVDNFTGASYIFAYPYSTKSIGATPAIYPNKGHQTERLAMIMKNTFEGKTVYHRLDVYDPTAKIYLDIKNNYHYIVKLREVNLGGYKTASEALEQPASNIQYDIIVEEEGDVIVGNGQYVLNVDTKGSEFTIAPAAGKDETLEVAVVNLVDSKETPLDKDPAFSVSLEEYFRVALATNDVVLTPPVNTTLGRSPKSLNIKAGGTGAVSFRYIATLGNIEYKSNLIAISSNFSDNLIAKSYGETLTFNVESLANIGDWSVVSDSPAWAPATKDGDKFNVIIASNDLGAQDRTAKITVSNNLDATITITIIQGQFPYFADRSVGTSFALTTVADLSSPANSRPKNPSSWKTEIPRRWFTWHESLTQCENWNFQDKKWRQPDKEDFDALLASGKLQVMGGSSTVILVQGDGSTAYFPSVGYSSNHGIEYGYFWSSTSAPGSSVACRLATSARHNIDANSGYRTHGLNVRCVLV